MIFDNSQIRRKDRTLTEALCLDLIKNSEYGVLSMYSKELGVYGIPINYVWDGESALYYHCAPEGKKLKLIEKNNNASFCLIGKSKVISDKFTTEYESVILSGKLFKNLSDDEKMKALILLLDKYCPEDKEMGVEYAKKSFDRTNILKFEIERFSGKSKKMKLP